MKILVTLVTIGYIVGFIVGMHIEYCLWAKWPYYSCDWIYWIIVALFGTGYAGFVFG